MKPLRYFAACIIAVCVLFGCGGGNQSLKLSQASDTSRGSATFTVTWPAPGRLIPAASNSVNVVITQGQTVVGQHLLMRPSGSGPTSGTFNLLPTGTLSATATAYPSVDGTGTAQASAVVPVAIQPNQTANISLTMESTVSQIALSPVSPTIEAGQSVALQVTATNASGAVVLISTGKLSWSTSNSTFATVDTLGVVTGVATGSANISVTETESGKSAATGVSVTTGPVSWWKAENNALDAEGLNNGLVSGGVSYAAGHTGQSFVFNGIDGVVNLGDPDSLKITGSLTIDAWVNVLGLPNPANQWGIIIFRGDDRVGLDPYYLGVSPSGQLEFGIYDNTPPTGNNIRVDAPITLGVMQHITCTLDNNTGDMRLYINGLVVGQTTTTVRPFRDLDPSYIGGVGIGNHAGAPASIHHFGFNGYIDELKIYNIVRPPTLVF